VEPAPRPITVEHVLTSRAGWGFSAAGAAAARDGGPDADAGDGEFWRYAFSGA